jgi:type II secretory pathway pseudopilin PulG
MTLKKFHRRAPERPAHRAQGFTLIELLVVLSIIIVIVGLSITIIAIAYGEGDDAGTKVLFERVLSAETEWRTTVGASDPHPGGIRDLINDCRDIPSAISFLEGAKDIFKRKDGGTGQLQTLQDPWGQELNYADGVVWSVGPDRTGGTDDDLYSDGR